jgi:hypothetical protein
MLRNGASGEHRRHRRGRSQPQPRQLGVACGACLDEVDSGRSRISRNSRRTEYLTLLEVRYERIPVEPFREPLAAEASAKGLPRERQST